MKKKAQIKAKIEVKPIFVYQANSKVPAVDDTTTVITTTSGIWGIPVNLK